MAYIAKAEQLAHRYGTRNPVIIAGEVGIDVIHLPYNEICGMACSLGEHRCIGVNSALDEPVQRLVVAHELGHFVLHPEGNFFFVLNQTMFYSKWEYQANMFAISLCYGREVAKSGFVKELAAGRMEKIIDAL